MDEVRLVIEINKDKRDKFRQKLFPKLMKDKITEWIDKFLRDELN